jgi:hypothetical protein
MTIRKAKVTAKAAADPKPVTLTLVQGDRGWTYAVDGVAGGDFLLDWREASAEKASENLLKWFSDEAFLVEVLEQG